MMLQMPRALFVTGRVDVEVKMVAAIPTHAGEQGPAAALWIVGLVIALRRDHDKIMISAGKGTGREHAQRRAFGWRLALPVFERADTRRGLLLLLEPPGDPVLDEPGG
jgi:hypothetical protein